MSLKLVHIRETLQVQCADLCRDGAVGLQHLAWPHECSCTEGACCLLVVKLVDAEIKGFVIAISF